MPSLERSDISCSATCPHSLVFANNPFDAFPQSSYLTLEASEFAVEYTQVPIIKLSKSEALSGFCPPPSSMNSQKPGRIIAEHTVTCFLLD